MDKDIGDFEMALENMSFISVASFLLKNPSGAYFAQLPGTEYGLRPIRDYWLKFCRKSSVARNLKFMTRKSWQIFLVKKSTQSKSLIQFKKTVVPEASHDYVQEILLPPALIKDMVTI